VRKGGREEEEGNKTLLKGLAPETLEMMYIANAMKTLLIVNMQDHDVFSYYQLYYICSGYRVTDTKQM